MHGTPANLNAFFFLKIDEHADLIGSSLCSHGDEGVVLLLQELSGLQQGGDEDLLD